MYFQYFDVLLHITVICFSFITDNGEVHGNTDIPPPPPPPPPQNSSIRIGQAKAGSVQNGNSVTPFMSLKTFHSQALPKPIQNSKNSTGSSMMNNSVPQMVPPPCSTPVKVQPISNKLSITSPLPAQLGNLLTSMKSPAQLKNDLSASLAALKGKFLGIIIWVCIHQPFSRTFVVFF